MRISLIGVGYVGLVTGACFAETGHHVVCMDVDNAKIEGLKGGRMPIYEPQLEEIVKDNVKEGRLEFTTSIKEAVDHGIIVCIAVNTPPRYGWRCRSFLCSSSSRGDWALNGEVSSHGRKIDRASWDV